MSKIIAVGGTYCPFCREEGGSFSYPADFLEGRSAFYLCENCNHESNLEEFDDALIAGYLDFMYHKSKNKQAWVKPGIILHNPPEFKNCFEWLLEVVMKAEQGDFGFKLCRKRVEIYVDSTKEVLFDIKLGSRLESLYGAVVWFVKHYYKPWEEHAAS